MFAMPVRLLHPPTKFELTRGGFLSKVGAFLVLPSEFLGPNERLLEQAHGSEVLNPSVKYQQPGDSIFGPT